VISAPDAEIVETGENSAPLVVLTQTALEARYPGLDMAGSPTGVFSGLQINVSDLDAARRCLIDAGVTVTESDLGLVVAPRDTSGVILEFVSA
jgi:hypothetical protein